jgi:hypothetical protein
MYPWHKLSVNSNSLIVDSSKGGLTIQEFSKALTFWTKNKHEKSKKATTNSEAVS